MERCCQPMAGLRCLENRWTSGRVMVYWTSGALSWSQLRVVSMFSCEQSERGKASSANRGATGVA